MHFNAEKFLMLLRSKLTPPITVNPLGIYFKQTLVQVNKNDLAARTDLETLAGGSGFQLAHEA